ncbi:MAG: phosphate ABC transporter ATP-binding protein [Candidatus Omnitrophota bacterium]|nr:phosphate ABC transporter ATP-binding protein [Candidatus Omnitrophota bacterium]
MVNPSLSKTKIVADNLHLWFGNICAVSSLNLSVFDHEILSVIGPANSGKTSFLRTLNRLNELNPNFRMQGTVYIDGEDIHRIQATLIRKRVGMVFALPMPLPLSIFDNIAYGPRMHGITNKKILGEIVEKSLRIAFLWDEVKDRLGESAMKLSGGQQQRLCLARTLAVEPEIILFDEPCSGLDPISTAKVEETMLKLKNEYTLILVTNNVKQAARVSDRTGFFLMGEMVEIDRTDRIFTTPNDKRTEDYIMGRFG